MDAFILIEILPETNFQFEKPILSFLREVHPEILLFDADNFSEKPILQLASKLIEESDLVLLLIESKGDAACGMLRILFEKLIKYKDKSCCILNGENAIAAKMLQKIPNIRYNLDIEAQKKVILDFFNC